MAGMEQNDGDRDVGLGHEGGVGTSVRIIRGPCDFSPEEWEALTPIEQEIVGMIISTGSGVCASKQ